MDIIVTYKSGRKRTITGCKFLEVNPCDERGFYYEKSGEEKCFRYDDVLMNKVEKVEIININ